STKDLKEQIMSSTHPIQKKISALNKTINDKVKRDQQLHKVFDEVFLQLDFAADEAKKEVLLQGLFELKEKNFISEETGENIKKQFDEILRRGHNNQL
ncbi:MAG: hypothetical protein KAI34_07875, partial [Candidatus Lokiarchaeota archaeon]|nr:hypothetical protein [Candidatus Lokiarchaeota archaeon]